MSGFGVFHMPKRGQRYEGYWAEGLQHGEDLAIVGLVLGYVATAGFVLVVGGILIRYWDIVVYLWKLTLG